MAIVDNMEKCYYNYVYLDPTKPCNTKVFGIDLIFKYQPFYVGKGKNNRKALESKGGSTNRHLTNTINKLIRDGNPPIIIQINKELSEHDAFQNEIYLIKHLGLRSNDGLLVNLTNGGGGLSGYKHTEETKLIISEKGKGRIVSEKTKEKISITVSKNHHMLGKLVSEKQYELLTTMNIGRKQTKDHIANCAKTKHKAVKQIDLKTGEIIRIFDSITEARKYTGASKISEVCRKTRNKSGGYFWEYV